MSKTLEIITVPHPTLRQQAKEVAVVDKKIKQFVSDLEATLDATRNPRGVGLAAPQVDKLWRIFATRLLPADSEVSKAGLRTFINPVIVKASQMQILGENAGDPDLEGCLSIPTLYGAVPRWEWVEIEYQTIGDNDQLIAKKERFADFPARVVQHEIDHLNGVLFIDHVLKYELPLYRQDADTKKLEEIDPSLIVGM